MGNRRSLLGGEDRTLVRMVCALFSSFWQFQKTDEKIGSKISAPRCTFDRGGGGLKLFGQCPYGTTHFKKGLPLIVLERKDQKNSSESHFYLGHSVFYIY